MRRLVAELSAEVIAGEELARHGDPSVIFANVNDPDGLADAEASLAAERESGQ